MKFQKGILDWIDRCCPFPLGFYSLIPNREDNVYGSKAVGEPPFMLGISVFEALRDAIDQARQPNARERRAVQLTAPATAENVLKALSD